MRAGQVAAREAIARCRALAAFSEEPGAITRTFLAAPMKKVHGTVSKWMRDAGMQVRVDAVGNLRGFYPGDGPRRLLIGSHLDTVPNAGAFDGILGVMLGVALVEGLKDRRLPYGIEVIGFSEEEGVRFGVPFIGSRGLMGRVDAALLKTRDRAGISVAEAIRAFGLDPAELAAARADRGAIGYLEFHIEQGPVLEKRKLPLGVVEAIVGQSRAAATFSGQASHAGTTPMKIRKDALAAASEWIVEVEKSAGECVATVGRLEVEPGAGNVIPGIARALLDVRHAEDRVRRAKVRELAAAARRIARRRGVSTEWRETLDQPAVPMDGRLTGVLAGAVRSAGFRVHRMNSGAGHDAMVLAPQIPAAMLFLRTPGGLSHHPDETVLPQDVAAALEVGRRFLETLS